MSPTSSTHLKTAMGFCARFSNSFVWSWSKSVCVCVCVRACAHSRAFSSISHLLNIMRWLMDENVSISTIWDEIKNKTQGCQHSNSSSKGGKAKEWMGPVWVSWNCCNKVSQTDSLQNKLFSPYSKGYKPEIRVSVGPCSPAGLRAGSFLSLPDFGGCNRSISLSLSLFVITWPSSLFVSAYCSPLRTPDILD